MKEVKIIGLRVNSSLGILESFDVKFDQSNKLIAVKGEVGSGKTTLQKGLKLGTLGSETLKDDKSLYGSIDQEVQLLDGTTNVFVGCKSNAKGGLDYVIFSKDENGKKILEPVVDGVKLTPSSYLKSLQTRLTWRMNELTSENPTIQKKILLELYKTELAGLGVIFDKKHPEYTKSILGRIELAESDRATKDVLRKQNGGFATHLLEKGFNVEKPETLPARIDTYEKEKTKNSLSFQIENISESAGQIKVDKLKEIKNDSADVLLKLKNYNLEAEKHNNEVEASYKKEKERFDAAADQKQYILDVLKSFKQSGYITEESQMIAVVNNGINIEKVVVVPQKNLVEFEFDVCTTRSWPQDDDVNGWIHMLNKLRVDYTTESAKEVTFDTTELEAKLQKVVDQLILDNQTNGICDSIDSFREWQQSNKNVIELKDEYANKLLSVDTGVEGLKICVDSEDEKQNIY